MQAVAQKDTYGCVIACLAAVTGVSYDDVRSILGEPGRGFTHITWGEFLYQRGYAVQFFYRHDPVAKSDRKVWPFEPWADVHLCSVDAGHGDGTHLIVLLRDGRVLDPISSEPKRLSDYPSVSYMAAVHSTGSAPCRLEH